jgi:hypothetical protein
VLRVRASREVLRPSGDIPVGVRLFSGFPGPNTFHPWTFSVLRRFSPPDGLPVLFHTSATYGIQSSKSFSGYAELAPRSGKGYPAGSPVPVRKATDSAGGRKPTACGHDACGAMWCFSESRVKLASERQRVTHLSPRCRVKSGRRAHQQPVRFSPGSSRETVHRCASDIPAVRTSAVIVDRSRQSAPPLPHLCALLSGACGFPLKRCALRGSVLVSVTSQ